MRPPEDTVLLRDMLDYARTALVAVTGIARTDLPDDAVPIGVKLALLRCFGPGKAKGVPHNPFFTLAGAGRRPPHRIGRSDADTGFGEGAWSP